MRVNFNRFLKSFQFWNGFQRAALNLGVVREHWTRKQQWTVEWPWLCSRKLYSFSSTRIITTGYQKLFFEDIVWVFLKLKKRWELFSIELNTTILFQYWIKQQYSSFSDLYQICLILSYAFYAADILFSNYEQTHSHWNLHVCFNILK